jgi:hypothetical protein
VVGAGAVRGAVYKPRLTWVDMTEQVQEAHEAQETKEAQRCEGRRTERATSRAWG